MLPQDTEKAERFVKLKLYYFCFLVALFASVIISTSLTFATLPLYLELSMETLYPHREELIGAAMNVGQNAFGAFFLAICFIPGIGESRFVENFGLCEDKGGQSGRSQIFLLSKDLVVLEKSIKSTIC